MLKRMSLALAVAVLLSSGSVADEKKKKELKSGLQPGDRIGAFTVTKCGGAKDDEIPVGEELCYRCFLGERPVVAVFTRKVDKNVTSLIGELDKLVAKNKKKELGSFVNLLGEDKEALVKQAKTLAKKAKTDNVAIVVPEYHKEGPEMLKLNKDADVTVLIYKEGIIEKNHALVKKELNKKTIAKILKDTDVILKESDAAN